MYRRRLCRLLRPLGKPEIKIQFGAMRTTTAAGLRRPQSRDVAKVLLVRAGRPSQILRVNQRYKGDSNFNHGAWRAIWGLFGGVLVG
jgi:hypothetical protein